MGVVKALGVRVRITAAVFLLGCVLGAQPASAAPTPAEVEAVFLFNFSQFVDWPAQAFSDPGSPIVIGVLGDDPFGAALDEVVRGEVVKGRALVVRRFRSIEELTDCHILFISRSERTRIEPILNVLKGRSVLTVSDLEGFAQDGGVICFVLMENKIRLRVNLEAAKAAGLILSSKLLRPAAIVGSRGN
jgi:YfiR/HmsC-like